MTGRLAALVLPLAAGLLLALPGRGEPAKAVPSWMTIEAAARLVRLDIVAGFNANNGALNFNGYFTGDMTVVVPVGWTVEIDFRNNDAMLPHSLLVTRPYATNQFPDKAGIDEVAIPRAYTDNPEAGIPAPKTDRLSFLAKDPGEYDLLCGAPAHAEGGMWTRLKIDPGAKAPYIVVAPGAEPGRR